MDYLDVSAASYRHGIDRWLGKTIRLKVTDSNISITTTHGFACVDCWIDVKNNLSNT